MKIREKIGLIGVGNMGTAILEGLFRERITSPDHVWVQDKIQEKVTAFRRRWRVNPASSLSEVLKNTDVILLAVKPQDLREAGSEMKPRLLKSQVVISILAGTPIAKLRDALGVQPALVRAMPNLGAKAGEAMTAVTSSDERALLIAEQIFSGCGLSARLPEDAFDLVTAVSGSGPAYFFLLMELLAEKGMEKGLSREVSELLAVQTAVGAALLARMSGTSPEELRKMVTSKGGTTEAALRHLEENKFPAVFLDAVEAALNRGRELSQGV